MAPQGSVWARRFILGALLQGAVMFLLTAWLLWLDLPWSEAVTPAAVVAFGSAGTWLTVGYVGYILFLVVGTGLSALFYHYIEVVMGRPYEGRYNLLAWGHLLFSNVTGGLALGLMMYGGYVGGAAMVSPFLGGGGRDSQWVHANVLGPLTVPLSILFLIAAAGPLLGGIGYFLKVVRKPSAP